MDDLLSSFSMARICLGVNRHCASFAASPSALPSDVLRFTGHQNLLAHFPQAWELIRKPECRDILSRSAILRMACLGGEVPGGAMIVPQSRLYPTLRGGFPVTASVQQSPLRPQNPPRQAPPCMLGIKLAWIEIGIIPLITPSSFQLPAPSSDGWSTNITV